MAHPSRSAPAPAPARHVSAHARVRTEMRLSRDGAELKHTRRTAGKVTCLAFSSAGSLLATGSDDSTVHLWDADTGDITFVCRKHRRAVWSVSFSPGGSRLASGGWDGHVCIWDPWTGNLVHHLEAHNGPVWAVVYSASGSILASGGRDQRIMLWNANTGQLLDYFKHGVVHPIYCVAINPQDTLLAEGSMDNTVRLWSLDEDSNIMRKLERSEKMAAQAATRTFQSREGQTALRKAKAKVRQKKFSFFGAEAGREEHADSRAREASPIGQEHPVRVLTRHTGPVVSVAFSLDGGMLVSASHDRTAILWDPASGNVLHVIKSASNSPVWCCVFSRDSTLLALGTGSGAVEFWDPQAPDTLLLSFQAHKSYIGSCAFSSDGLLLGTGSDDKTFRLWSLLSPPDLLKLCHDRIRREKREQELEAARQREMEQLEQQRKQRAMKRKEAQQQAEDLYRQSVESSRASTGFSRLREHTDASRTPTTARSEADDDDDAAADEEDELNRARAAALRELIRLKQQALQRETNAVAAMQEAIHNKREELARQTRMEVHRLALRKDQEQRGMIGGPIGVEPSKDLEYVDAIHRRLQQLYKRVGREPRGNTTTELALEGELVPDDLERQAQFQQVLLRTLDYQEYTPGVLPQPWG
ncbi:hypothetical protein PTSG_04037 [Salpingoeca rosetta]|uniref:Uncharacterized protein n=1 Tax=Salpingoeca rosetta (strain ATCC 50818 / BSB-021) TaxID=946362 RepID=F2U7L3_SALR5|nr:uncharacterized protein PTSG_04037 [Salpingoeca rosetta]EGD83430.1 hypothetical protein PTSG_04037 [Salpingoeca rosetta]|eukprot:XP_004994934.1 hypothetical protein PTSG_04037 [Salpingoeca rosetta]